MISCSRTSGTFERSPLEVVVITEMISVSTVFSCPCRLAWLQGRWECFAACLVSHCTESLGFLSCVSQIPHMNLTSSSHCTGDKWCEGDPHWKKAWAEIFHGPRSNGICWAGGCSACHSFCRMARRFFCAHKSFSFSLCTQLCATFRHETLSLLRPEENLHFNFLLSSPNHSEDLLLSSPYAQSLMLSASE